MTYNANMDIIMVINKLSKFITDIKDATDDATDDPIISVIYWWEKIYCKIDLKNL